MSVMPICAMIDPSFSSTIECTIDCGCTTTSICDGGTPNSQCASITSRPLFISVAESIVIFGPICHVGCFSASAAVTFVERRQRSAAERAARRGEDQPPQLAARRGRAGTGGSRCARCRRAAPPRPSARAASITRPPAITSTSLLASAMVLPASIAHEHGVERRGAGRSAQHDVDVGMRGDLAEPFVADAGDLRRRSAERGAQLVHRLAGGHRHRARAVTRAPASTIAPTLVAGGERHDFDAIAMRVAPRPARSCRSIRSSRGWRCASFTIDHRTLTCTDSRSRRPARRTAARRCDRARRRGRESACRCPSCRRRASASTRTDRR